MSTDAAADKVGAWKEKVQFVQGLGLLDSTMIVMGSMIGSGIFIVSANIAHDVRSPIMLLLVWIVTGLMTIFGALAYGELAAMMPKAGGQYVYLRESFGPLWGFLYGWTLFLVIQTGTIAAVAVAFGKFMNVFVPAISLTPRWHLLTAGSHEFTVSTGQLVAMFIVVLLSVVNCFGIRWGALIQNLFTFAKTAGLVGLILVAFAAGQGSWSHFKPVAPEGLNVSLIGFLMIFGGALVGSLFSADAWNNITFTAGEVKNPKRNLPLSLVLGTSLVILIYCMANVAYVYVMPWQQIANVAEIQKTAQTATIGTEIIKLVAGGVGAKLFALAILVSVFGCANGLILAGARVYYSMAQDNLFFKRVGELNPKYHTPVLALLIQSIWTALLCLSGTYSQLLDYVMFATVLFYVLTVAGLFVLRRKRPDAERPYRTVGYPVLPAIYILLAALFSINLLFVKPENTWPGLLIVLLGVPVYFLWRRKNTAQKQS